MSEKFPHLNWHEVCDRVARITFRLYIYQGEDLMSMGTGFLVLLGRGPKNDMAVIATAWHVISDAKLGTALRICDKDGRELVRSKGGNIAVTEVGDDLDVGLVIVNDLEGSFKEEWLCPILPKEFHFKRGSSIGWLGYPGLTEPELCFFQGHVSGMFSKPPVYLVDGVAINGVSGGPVFDDRCHLAGLVSAYLPNHFDDTKTTLPGVSMMVPINSVLYWVESVFKGSTKHTSHSGEHTDAGTGVSPVPAP